MYITLFTFKSLTRVYDGMVLSVPIQHPIKFKYLHIIIVVCAFNYITVQLYSPFSSYLFQY